MQNFPKNERLCGKNNIANLFSSGSSIKQSFLRLVWGSYKFNPQATAKIVFVVPKKNIKKAVNRNLLKRRMREAFYQHKSELYKIIKKKEEQLAIAIIYQSEELLSYKVIDEKIKLILHRLSEDI